jgi:ABC-type multidrug transport system ATPase subunit
MIETTIRCPKCKKTIKIQGDSGEKKDITCLFCNTKGSFIFQENREKHNIKSNSSVAIEVNNLNKKYSNLKAVNNVTFKVKSGEIFGFLGPNGAGKTTTIKSILGLISTDSGSVKINGFDIIKHEKDAKKYIGYLPEKVAFYDNLTALQNLSFYAEMKDASLDECKNLIGEFGLLDAVNKKVGNFSKGMVQRLGMARAVLGNPPILILDEPSGGLDPRGVMLIREKIRAMKKKGSTVFVSSHILSEIQEVCDRVGIINNGILVAKDSVEELGKKLNLKPRITVQLENISTNIFNSVRKTKGVDKVEKIGKSLEIICDSKTKARIILTIAKEGGDIVNLYTKEPSLEEVFMRFTGVKK